MTSETAQPTNVGSNDQLGLRWADAPQRTQWGAGMMEALLALGKDHTLRLYAEADALHLVVPALVDAAVAAERERCAQIVREADKHGCACSDRDELARVILGA